MKQKVVTFMLALLATAVVLFAQNRTVTGVVSDDQGPVVGASVMEKGTNNGTITDLDGKYTLSVRPGATLVFSSIGYAAQEIAVGSQSPGLAGPYAKLLRCLCPRRPETLLAANGREPLYPLWPQD